MSYLLLTDFREDTLQLWHNNIKVFVFGVLLLLCGLFLCDIRRGFCLYDGSPLVQYVLCMGVWRAVVINGNLFGIVAAAGTSGYRCNAVYIHLSHGVMLNQPQPTMGSEHETVVSVACWCNLKYV